MKENHSAISRFLAKVPYWSKGCLCRWLELENPTLPISLESRLIRLIGWRDSLGKQVRVSIEVLEGKP